MARAPRNPVIPGNAKDRTGTGGIRRRAGASIRRRFELIETEVRSAFDTIPVYALNDTGGPVVRYGITAEVLARIAASLQATLDRWIGSGARTVEQVFWWDVFVDDASQLGTAQSAANLSALSPTYAAAQSLFSIVHSQPYVERLATAKFKSYEHWTGLASEQRADLAQLIGRAVSDGLNPKAARRLISDRLGVGMAKALAYAQSDITDTLRMARVAESERAKDEFGIETALLWTSALIPTTRTWHATRHGKVFTPDEVRAFYAENGNRYNCHCATTECLLDAKGEPILTQQLRDTMARERKAWERT